MSAAVIPRRASYATVVRENPDFRRIWIGQVGSLLGDWFNQVAILSLLLRLTGSGSAAGVFWVLQMVPIFLVSPIAGRVVDHLPRKLVMIAADLARAVLLAFPPGGSARPHLDRVRRDRRSDVLSSFFEPARTRVTPRVVKPGTSWAPMP
jgi:MFS family permease